MKVSRAGGDVFLCTVVTGEGFFYTHRESDTVVTGEGCHTVWQPLFSPPGHYFQHQTSGAKDKLPCMSSQKHLRPIIPRDWASFTWELKLRTLCEPRGHRSSDGGKDHTLTKLLKSTLVGDY